MSKVLAWSSLGTTVLFAIVASVGLLAWDSLGAAVARGMILGSMFLLITAILLAVSILVLESFTAGGPAETTAVPSTEPKAASPLFADLAVADAPAELAADAEPSAETAPETDTDDDF